MAAHPQRSQPTAHPFPTPTPTATARGIVDKRQISSRPLNDPALASGAIHVSNNSVSSQNSNPFRTPKHSPHTSASSNSFIFSPVSPVEDERRREFPQPTSRSVPVTRSRNMSQEPRKSVDLRTIDGKPYPGREAEADGKPRKVKVAQDMYAGELPPGYEKQDYKAPVAPEKGHKHTDSCHKCGGHRKVPSVASVLAEQAPVQPPSSPQNIDCNKCGGRRSTPPSSYPGAARNMPVIQSSEAGPSNAPHVHKHKCNKCGRRKRPESMSTSSSTSQPQSPQQSQYPRTIPIIQTNGIPVGINIEPPTALTERAPTLPFSPASTVGETPLLNGQPQSQIAASSGYKKGHNPARSGSISSLFRSLSRRKKSTEEASPAPPLPTDTQGGAGRKSNTYARLSVEDRPPSPFSFVDKPQEEQTFELNDIRRSKLPERRDSWDKADESTMFLSTEPQPERPKLGRSQSTTAAKYPSADAQPVDDIYLSLPPDQRPGITRFKSLRTGVNRAANGLSRSASQIGRSTSLRRLESVKKVPSLWYRDDMAIEGASSEYDNYGY